MPDKQASRTSQSPTIVNKKARFDYDVLETIEVGLILVGTEVKAIRAGRVSLDEAYVRFIAGRPYLVGANVSAYEMAGRDNHDPLRHRQLLMHKREINRLLGKVKEKGLTLVPLKLYFSPRGYAKLLIGLAKGKTLHDKRRAIRDRDMRRDMQRQMRKYR